MSELNYSLENLRALMASSTAYQSLSDAEKAGIEQHIAKNNKPVLLYIFQKLREEADSHEISRQKLAEKVLQIKPSDQQNISVKIHDALSNSEQ